MKYQVPNNQDEILPNKLGLKTTEEIGRSEFEGFLKAEIIFSEKLTSRTKFNVNYIKKLHKTSLGHLYSFAGSFRDVNMSKGGFPFASARFLSQTMAEFENEILLSLPNHYSTKEALIVDLARVHGELLVIHPFREGNGRTARILANLMAFKQGFDPLKFEMINDSRFEQYVEAVQSCAKKDYAKMEKIMELIFPD
jgi:cell filamentation protein